MLKLSHSFGKSIGRSIEVYHIKKSTRNIKTKLIYNNSNNKSKYLLYKSLSTKTLPNLADNTKEEDNKKSSSNIIGIKKNKKPNLIKILSDENIKKIFHYARADLAHIKYYLKTDVKNVECTKIQSKLARTFTDSHSLKTLIKAFTNIDVSKQFQTSDFGGELTPDQMKYCSNDVIYLHKIHDELNKILERENRMDLYQDCIKFLKTRVDLDLALFKEDIWSH